MTSFNLTLTCNNAAFEPDPLPEVARILRVLADKLDSSWYLEADGDSMFLSDINGNKVGFINRLNRGET